MLMTLYCALFEVFVLTPPSQSKCIYVQIFFVVFCDVVTVRHTKKRVGNLTYLVLNLQNKTRMSTRIGCGQQQRFVEQRVCVPLCFCCQELSKMWQCRQHGGRLTHQCPHPAGLLLVTCGSGSPWLVPQLLQTVSLSGENITSSKRKKYSCFLSYPPKGDTF